MRYSIFEGNLERLEKKMVKIKNKCKKYGCDFHFDIIGEEFKDIEQNGEKVTTRFIVVDAEGIARINGWRFIASVDATEKGNIINKAVDVEVPERYYNCDPFCEHCKENRKRKYTYIVQNEETGEFKQVGKSCLKDFTNGMSAEAVAGYTAMFDELIEGEAPMTGCNINRFYRTEEYLRYVAETIRHFGYVKSENPDSTKARATNYYGYNNGWFNGYFSRAIREEIGNEIKKYGIDADRPENYEDVKNALAWVKNQGEDNNYIHNLKTACALDYIDSRYFGILASLFPTYNKDLLRQEKNNQELKKSEWFGNIGDKVDFAISDFKCLTGWQTQFGYTYLYKIVDNNGNIFTWKTQKCIDSVKTIKGTIKAHNEFRGIKQTELTRCKIA